MAFCLHPRNPNSQHSIGSDKTLPGKTYSILGKTQQVAQNCSGLLRVPVLTYFALCTLTHFSHIATPLRKERKNRPKGFWQDANNRRQYFVNFAKEQGFDPSDAEAWKKVTWRKVQAKEVLAKNIQICINNTFENKREEAQFSFMDLYERH